MNYRHLSNDTSTLMYVNCVPMAPCYELLAHKMEFGLDLVLLLVAWGHVLAAPYTKVEESFNLHATHDVFFYGLKPTQIPNVRKSSRHPCSYRRRFLTSAIFAV